VLVCEAYIRRMQCDFPFDWTSIRRTSVQHHCTQSLSSCENGDVELIPSSNQEPGPEKKQAKPKSKKRKNLSLEESSCKGQATESTAKRIYTKKKNLVVQSELEQASQDNEHKFFGEEEDDTLCKDSMLHADENESCAAAKEKTPFCNSHAKCTDFFHSKSFLNPIGNKTQMLQKDGEDHNSHQEPKCHAPQKSLSMTSSNKITSIAKSTFSGEIRDLILKQISLSIRTCSSLVPNTHASAEKTMCTESDLFSQILNKEEETYLKQKKRDMDQFLDTDSLISKLPYKKMLLDIFGGNLRGNLQMMDIPYVTRVYEESFMREPLNSSERECAKGKLCECMFIDKKQQFVGVEFLLPGEKQQRNSNMCVLCYRQMTQQLYYDVIFDKCEFPGCIQKFGNIHSEKGEYLLDAMLIAAPTAPSHVMPIPIVSHQRNRYTVYVSGGIKRLSQSRVYFQNTPSYLTDLGM